MTIALLYCCISSGSFGNKGCNGGDTLSVFKYIIANDGVDKASYYPYKAQVYICNKNVQESMYIHVLLFPGLLHTARPV